MGKINPFTEPLPTTAQSMAPCIAFATDRSKADSMLWAEALAAFETMHGTACSAFHLAAAGHENAIVIARNALADVTGCPCGSDELCEPSIDTPERIVLREKLTALVASFPHE